MRLGIGPGVLAVVLLSPPAGAQTPETPLTPAASGVRTECPPAAASVDLRVNDVRAPLSTNGVLFYPTLDRRYEVPFDPGSTAPGPSPLFQVSLWIGGEVRGSRRFAGTTYGSREYWPGPLDVYGETRPGRCAEFDTLWRVSVDDLETYSRTGQTPNADLPGWPIAQGAPYFVDANGNDRRDPSEPRLTLGPGDDGYSLDRDEGAVLDLAAGERPDLVGDQAVWWVMNDSGDTHEWSGSAPIGVEVQVLAFAFRDAAEPALSQATFYEYTVVNRGVSPLVDSRVSFLIDPDIGDAEDDFLASDSTRGLLIGYNGDEVDQGAGRYGRSVPALGADLLSGAVGVFALGGPSREPNPGEIGRLEYATNAQRGLWEDRVPVTRGGDGYNPGSIEITTWSFDGDPVSYGYWTQEQPQPEQQAADPDDQKAVINAPPVTLAPGESRRVDLAILFAEGAADRTRLHSVSRLRDISDAVQTAYDTGGTASLRDAEVVYTPPPPAPSAAPALLSPLDGIDFNGVGPDVLTFEWAPVDGADAYALTLGPSEFRTTATSLTTGRLPTMVDSTVWSVRALNWGGEGPSSETRRFSYLIYSPAPQPLSDGSPAFVEVVGPGGVDPCGPNAQSPFGCGEGIGNGIYGSLNSTGAYVGGTPPDLDGTEFTIGQFAPRDFDIRFTDEGSYGYYGFTTGNLIEVPFEIWDIGVTPPGQPNDPADDVQMIPVLYTDGEAETECAFGYVGPTAFGYGAITQRIYAYYPTDTYEAFEAEAAPVVAADPNGCPTDPASARAGNEIGFSYGRPIQRFVLEQADPDVGIDDLTGTVIRFYTTDPRGVPAEAAPEAGDLALAVHPNPVRGAASVPFSIAAPGDVRLRVVDVLGREVAVLADGPRAAGEHRAALDASRLAAGVYVVVLDADGQRTAQTITVVR